MTLCIIADGSIFREYDMRRKYHLNMSGEITSIREVRRPFVNKLYPKDNHSKMAASTSMKCFIIFCFINFH